MRNLLTLLLIALLYCQGFAQHWGDFSTRAPATRADASGRADVTGGGSDVVFVTDTFTDANGTDIVSHTGETGASWTKHTNSDYNSGAGAIQDNRLYNTGGNVVFYASGVPSSPDYDVQANVHVVTVVSGRTAGVAGRISNTSANTMYQARYTDAGTFTLTKIVTGSQTTLGTYDPTDLTPGQSATIKLSMVGSTIKMFVDGVERVSVTDTAITAAGRAGVRLVGAGSSTTAFHLDTFSALHPGAGGGSGRPNATGRANITFGQNAQLPLSTPSETPIDTTGYNTYNVPSQHATVLAAANAAKDDVDGGGNFPGARIVIDSSQTFDITTSGGLPAITSPNPNGKYIQLASSSAASLPARGTRVNPASHSALMPKFRANGMPTSGSSSSIFNIGANTSYYAFLGIHFTIAANQKAIARFLELGSDTVSDPNQQAHHVFIDRCIFTGHDDAEIVVGIRTDVDDYVLIDSWTDEIHDLDADSQAFNAINGGRRVLIKNNRIAASGENMMLGGGNPQHPDLMPSDWTITRNHFIKPIAWRSSTIVAPVITSQTLQAGGSLTVGLTYRWAIQPRGAQGNVSLVSGQYVLTNTFVPTSGNQQVTLQWNKTTISTANPHDASQYRVFQSSDGGSTWVGYDTVTSDGSPSYSITMGDDSPATAATALVTPSTWLVKNNIEFKEGKRILFQGNLVENSWEDGQEGYLMKITVSVSNTALSNVGTYHLTFKDNVWRHGGLMINMLGSDSSTSLTQVHTITFENNLVENITANTFGGGPANAIYIHKGSTTGGYRSMPQNVKLIHNTFINASNFIRIDNDAPPTNILAHNWVISCNIGNSNTRGVDETENFVNAGTSLNTNFVNLVFRSNVIAGNLSGSTFGAYQALNFFPTTASYGGVGFVSYSGSYPYPPGEGITYQDLSLSGASPFKNACYHGRDPGANIAQIEAATGLDLTP
jgi:hypothetical protein